MWEEVRLRKARQDEAELLSALALRSKAHWGYDAAFLAACRDELRLRSRDVVARRVVVAERDGRVLGFATLDGDQPNGALGMLFVDPDAIGGGVGRLLYRHVFDEAGRMGFARLTIEADPHAEGFYRAMGAEPVGFSRGQPLLVAWPRRPERSWVTAWTGGRPAVHIGNVAEFNAQFGRISSGPDHYSCLAAFASPHPALLVLPAQVDAWWVRHLADTLGWGEVELHSGIAGHGRVAEAIMARPALAARLTSARERVLPWGRTHAFGQVAPSPRGVLESIRRFESKRGAHLLFRALAPDHPGIVVPAQRPVDSRRALMWEPVTRVPLVLKSEYGVGGSGTFIIPAGTRLIRSVAGRRALDGVMLLEEYVEGSGPFRNPTFDAVIDADGIVHSVGVGLMEIVGTSYQGVTVGPGVAPDPLTETALRFGTAVGRALAEFGYRGWYDVDFVGDRAGRLAPAEINLRLTGPAAAFNIQARLDRLHGGHHLVRTLDYLPLGARLPPPALREHIMRVEKECRDLGANLLLTIPTAAFDPAPYVGVAIAAREERALREAETAVRAANTALGAMFTPVSLPAGRAWRPGSRRRRPPRSSG